MPAIKIRVIERYRIVNLRSLAVERWRAARLRATQRSMPGGFAVGVGGHHAGTDADVTNQRDCNQRQADAENDATSHPRAFDVLPLSS